MTSRFIIGLWKGPDEENLDWKCKTIGRHIFYGLDLIKRVNAKPYAFDARSMKEWKKHGIYAEYLETDVNTDDPFEQYRCKLVAMWDALKTYDEVVWLDLGVVMLRKLPDDFWSQVRKGQPIQAKLFTFKRTIKCPWREVGDPEDDQRKSCPVGSFIYCRDRSIIENCFKAMMDDKTMTEEAAIARVIDDREGGWHGKKEYWKRGYDPPLHLLNSAVYRTEDAVFLGGRSLGISLMRPYLDRWIFGDT